MIAWPPLTRQPNGTRQMATSLVQCSSLGAPLASVVRANMNQFCINRVANALIPNARPASTIGGTTLWSIKLVEQFVGGLWVGGEVTLSNEGVNFQANKLNESFHIGLAPIHIPLEDIVSVKKISGWVTDIVSVKHSGGEFRFRCYGATELVNEFNANVSSL